MPAAPAQRGFWRAGDAAGHDDPAWRSASPFETIEPAMPEGTGGP
jgi:hypothetical protein